MADMKSTNKLGKTFEQELSQALKYYGFDMPESEEEIDKYVRTFGNTKIELPNSISDAEMLFDKLSEARTTSSDSFSAMAAQGEEGDTLSDDVLEDIKKDIKSGKRVNKGENGNIKSGN